MRTKNKLAAVILAALAYFITEAPLMSAERVVMLGDSLTAGFNWRRVWPEAVNLGVGGDTVAGVLLRTGEVAAENPSKIFLMIGVNDLGRLKPEALIAGQIRIWEELRAENPAAALYVISLLPVDESRFGRRNELIETINKVLAVEAEKRGLPFIDLYHKMLDARGQLREEFTYDGLHLTPSAYRVWVETLRPYYVGR